MPIGLVILCTLSARAAAENVWQSTFGQGWFYESQSWSGQTLAGAWWEDSLTPGNTYQISFNVKTLKGKAGLFVGNRKMITLDHTGSYSYQFKVWNGGKRRLMFTAASNNATVGVNNIVVQRAGEATASGGSGGGGGHWLPKGHYWSFARERNIKEEMRDVLAHPRAANGWQLEVARGLQSALTTPGVKGFSMYVDWRTLETGDGKFDFSLLDANMAVARQLGLKFIIQVGTRSYDGSNIMPKYFPSRYVIRTGNSNSSGFVAKLWDPWVYNRLIRLYKRIAWRYGGDSAFGGVATSETAIANVSGGNYSYWKYRTALIKIATETQAALKRGRFFFYLNFLKGGISADMRKDGRVQLVDSIPHHALAVGGPDITPDVRGMPGSATSFRIHLRKTKPNVQQFCHAQHRDQGKDGINRKTNRHRWDYINHVRQVRSRERQRWFKGPKAIFQFDDVRNGAGQNVHPEWQLGALWKPWEVFNFANRNFDCDYFLWNYRENVFNKSTEYWWPDVQRVIRNNQYFHK